MPVLDLKQGAFAKVWLETIRIMQSDPVLQAAISCWVVWDGTNPPDEASASPPMIRMDPTIGPMAWFDPASQAGFLQVRIRLVVQSFDATDYLNLWEAVMDSLYPRGERERQLDIEHRLEAAGAMPGQWEFAIPAAVPNRPDADGMFSCDGMMRINVIHQFM